MTSPPSLVGLAAFDLRGQTVLITGGAGLLGPEHAAAVLELGARVILTDIDGPRLAETVTALGASADQLIAAEMDVTSEVAIRRVDQAHGPVDVLINNAAVDPKVDTASAVVEESSRVEHLPLAEWDRHLRIGLTGAFLCARILGTGMAMRGRGSIVNIASDLSVIAPDQRLYRRDDRAAAAQPVKPVTYSVVKTGLIGLTRYLAAYWAADGVRVNALSPGGVFHHQPEAFTTRLSALIPMGRMAHRSEYRAAVQFLCSPASSYLTGQNIVMDGGRSIL